MGAHTGSEGTPRGRAGRHRRTGQALIERRDHVDEAPARRFVLPAPPPSALVGIAVLVLIAVGVIHLSGSGSAVPLEAPPMEAARDDSGTSGEAVAEPDSDSGGAETGGEPATDPAASPGATPSGLIIHVSGAVSAPGVVHLPGDARVDEALQAAGGATQEADLSAVNLARPLADGEQIHVPVPGEAPPPSTGGAGDAAAGTDGGGTIDLNTASTAQLEELPGVGPAIAQRILEHREKNGPFTSVEGLLEVSGIGPTTLEKIREQATV